MISSKGIKKDEISKESSEPRVNVKDDYQMVELGIRPPLLAERDKSVWTKTAKEKKLLKKLRHGSNNCHFGTVPIKPIPVRDKLIVYLKKNNVFPKTTYSTECRQHEIGEILMKYFYTAKSGISHNLVMKYEFNGKSYLPNERPYWK